MHTSYDNIDTIAISARFRTDIINEISVVGKNENEENEYTYSYS